MYWQLLEYLFKIQVYKTVFSGSTSAQKPITHEYLTITNQLEKNKHSINVLTDRTEKRGTKNTANM